MQGSLRNINSQQGGGGIVPLAAACAFQLCGISTSVDSDEPVQPPFKLRNSKYVRSVA